MNRIEPLGRDAVGIRANNPSAFTLTGTNTWIVGREPAWVIDPGPALPEHLDEISDEIDARGGLGAIILTHDHIDHADAVPVLVQRFSPVPVASARELPGLPAPSTHGPPPHIELHDGDQIGPLHVIAVPGHAPDHLVFVSEDGIAYTGDAVLGEGSVFVATQLGEYLAGLAKVRAALSHMNVADATLIAPGHGPLVTDADAKLSEYMDHRLEREQRLLAALDSGLRSSDELLDAVWGDAPPELRAPAGWTMAAHLDKLDAEGLVPEGVQWPARPDGAPRV